MSASQEFVEFVMESLEPLPAIQGKKFFGGYAIKSGATQFAMIMGNNLYFAVNDKSRPKYETLKMQPFSYATRNGQRLVKKYYAVPEGLFEDRDTLLAWARESIAAANVQPVKR